MVYTIIFVFIQASFEFIRIIIIGLVKGIPRILGLYYKNSKSRNKQPVNLQSFSNLRDIRLALTLVILRTNIPQ